MFGARCYDGNHVHIVEVVMPVESPIVVVNDRLSDLAIKRRYVYQFLDVGRD